MQSAKNTVDVVVVGSGPAGSAAALTLARGGASVLMIDKTGGQPPTIGEVLPPSAIIFLRELGVWEAFLSDHHSQSYGNCSLWGSPCPQDYPFILEVYGPGWHLDRDRFNSMLVKAALTAGATGRVETRLVRCSKWAEGPWELDLVSRGVVSQIRADFIIDASGRSAVFAGSQGAKRSTHDRLVGVVTQVHASEKTMDQDSSTLIEAVQNGWWYAALLPTGRLAVVYLSDADLIHAKSVRTIAGWTGLLQETKVIRQRVVSGGYRLEETPRIVSASSSVLNKVAGDSWLAVGDAAATHDPLSCHGIISALASGLHAARAILTCPTKALEAYGLWVQEMFASYLAYRAAYYAMEQQWSHSPFWRRRNGISCNIKLVGKLTETNKLSNAEGTPQNAKLTPPA